MLPFFSSLSQGFYPIVSQFGFVKSAQTLSYIGLCPPNFQNHHAKVSNLLSCLPTLHVRLKTSRVVDKHTSFSNLSSPPNFLTQVSASSWAFMVSWRAYKRGWLVFTQALHVFSVCHSVLCTVPQTSTLDQLAFQGCPHILTVPDIQATPSHIEINGQLRISSEKASFPRLSWLALLFGLLAGLPIIGSLTQGFPR